VADEKPYPPGITSLFEVVARLRAPDGCPWDREQTHESLRPYLLEETYELLEAIDAGDDAKMKEELGDLLLQVAMHAEIAAQEGRFDAAQVSEAAAAKMVARHPHVFGDVSVANSDEVLRNWEHNKEREARKAGREDDSAEAVAEEARELAEAKDPAAAFDELGDLLFAVVSLSRRLKVNPEDALRVAGRRFRKRFAAMESQLVSEGKSFRDLDAAELAKRWDEEC